MSDLSLLRYSLSEYSYLDEEQQREIRAEYATHYTRYLDRISNINARHDNNINRLEFCKYARIPNIYYFLLEIYSWEILY